MTDFSDSPIKKILFDKLVEMGRLDPNPTKQTMQTINEISDSDALKLLKSLTISLMLETSFLGGSSSEKIKELENAIRQIELELQ